VNPSFQAGMDWRDEGCFRPSQYPAGSKEQREYLAEQKEILNRDEQSIDLSEATQSSK